MWNPTGFDVVDRLSNDIKMNNAYFVAHVFVLLEETIFSQGMAPHQKRLAIHLDNC
jgi:hypothetical protein